MTENNGNNQKSQEEKLLCCNECGKITPLKFMDEDLICPDCMPTRKDWLKWKQEHPWEE